MANTSIQLDVLQNVSLTGEVVIHQHDVIRIEDDVIVDLSSQQPATEIQPVSCLARPVSIVVTA